MGLYGMKLILLLALSVQQHSLGLFHPCNQNTQEGKGDGYFPGRCWHFQILLRPSSTLLAPLLCSGFLLLLLFLSAEF